MEQNISFMRYLRSIKRDPIKTTTITLGPLRIEDINILAAEALHTTTEITLPLAKLVIEKTLGNPFFAERFFKEMYHKKLLVMQKRKKIANL
jgi:predicted ATPase